MTAHDDAQPDDMSDAEAFHFEGEWERYQADLAGVTYPVDFEDYDGPWPAQSHDEERYNDEGCTPGGWAKSPI